MCVCVCVCVCCVLYINRKELYKRLTRVLFIFFYVRSVTTKDFPLYIHLCIASPQSDLYSAETMASSSLSSLLIKADERVSSLSSCSSRRHSGRFAGVCGPTRRSAALNTICCTLSNNVASSSSSSSSIEGDYYEFCNHACYYESKGDRERARVHVVFLHGFGTGTFHYRKQLETLGGRIDDDDDDDDDGSMMMCAWSMDICGQGKSWPRKKEDIAEFEYSMDTWAKQVEFFVREIVLRGARKEDKPTKVVLAGNSLGGKLALYVSATCDDAVDGIVLLNATPFWGFLKKRIGFLNKENDVLVRLTQPYWDTFRSKENVRRLLNMVYADETKIEESLIDDIIEPTENEFAIRAFISTFTSPKASKMSYDEMLETIRDRNESLRVGLVYGREDPWVVPLWGQRLKRVIKNATYYELSPVGHCPNDEAPEAVNLVIESLVRDWFFNDSDDDAVKASSVPLPKSIQGVSIELVDGSPRNAFEKMDYWKDQFFVRKTNIKSDA